MTEQVQDNTKHVITIGNATVDVGLFAGYQKEAMEHLLGEHGFKQEAREKALDFKEVVEACHLTTKIPKGELTKYWKARFEESLPKEDDAKPVGTKVTINRGEMYTLLNAATEV